MNVWEPIKNAVKSKGNKYGELPHPLLIAINVNGHTVDRIYEMQGLFGQEEYVFNVDNQSAPPQMHRKPNGAWYGPKGPQYTRVSGVWIFDNLTPWNLAVRKNTVYFNPWTINQLPLLFGSINHAKVEKEKMQWIEGRPLYEILGLTADWPR